ncbi:MAG: beta-ketoacyl-[acyl-carrier-protein] synthase family protein [Phycisphaerales bacterium]
MSRRVVITGLGSVCALGVGMDALWAGLMAGRTNLGPLKAVDARGFRSRLAGEVEGFSAKDYVPKHYRKAVKVMARDIELAVGAAKTAVEDAGLVTRGTTEDGGDAGLTYRPERMGCHIGAGLIAAETEEMSAAMATARDESGAFSLRRWGGEGGGGMDALTPLWLLKYLPNMLACHVTIIHGCEGPSNTITCAESSGPLSIGESARVIERGDADLCFSGGAESKLNCMGILRMDLAGRLAATGEAGEGSAFVKPYDPSAAGGILGEGGGILILEAEETARARGAKVYAEVAGFGGGQSLAGYEGPDDEGYRNAVLNALDDAGIGPEVIDAVVPLASSIPGLDTAEAGALRSVFGERLARVPMVHFGANIGNCTAGAGALQAAVAAKCLAEQALPARVHAGKPDRSLDAAAAPARSAKLTYVLVCTGALGGQNAALVLRAAG